MNIGIVTTWFERGAAYVSRQYLNTLKKKFNVYVYARGGEEYAIKDQTWDSEIIWWGRKSYLPISTAIDIADFRKWLNEKKIEVVIFNEQRWWLPVIRCKQWGLNTIAYIDYYTSKTIPLFNLYDSLICHTKRHAQAFNWHKEIHYVPWGTDIGVFKPKQTGLVEKGIVTFFHSCGHNPFRKNSAMVINCFAQLRVPARLIIHSQVDIGIKDPKIKEIFEKLITERRIIYFQKTISAPGLYGLGDVYVYPSISDGLGLTVAEAIASGLACLVTDDSPMNEFFSDEYAQKIRVEKHFSQHNDPYYWPKAVVSKENLRKKMEYCASHPDWVAVAKTKARRFAEDRLDWNKNGQELFGILEALPKPSPPNRMIMEKARLADREALPYDWNLAWLYRMNRVIDLSFKAIGRSLSRLDLINR